VHFGHSVVEKNQVRTDAVLEGDNIESSVMGRSVACSNNRFRVDSGVAFER
jgi:hypothetical protein